MKAKRGKILFSYDRIKFSIAWESEGLAKYGRDVQIEYLKLHKKAISQIIREIEKFGHPLDMNDMGGN